MPTVGGTWLPARRRVLGFVGDRSAGLARPASSGYATEETPAFDRWLVGCSSRRQIGRSRPPDQTRWENSCSAVGVHDGLPLTRVAVERTRRHRLQPPRRRESLELQPSLQEAWQDDVSGVARWRPSLHALPLLLTHGGPAWSARSRSSWAEASEIFAELLSLGLATWPTTPTRSWCHGRSADRPAGPTQVADSGQLLPPHGCWVPVEGTDVGGERRSCARLSAWLSAAGQLPRFVPNVQPAAQSSGGSPRSRPAQGSRIRIWDEPHYCGDVLRRSRH